MDTPRGGGISKPHTADVTRRQRRDLHRAAPAPAPALSPDPALALSMLMRMKQMCCNDIVWLCLTAHLPLPSSQEDIEPHAAAAAK